MACRKVLCDDENRALSRRETIVGAFIKKQQTEFIWTIKNNPIIQKDPDRMFGKYLGDY